MMPMRTIHFLHIGKTGGTVIKHALSPHCHGATQRIMLHEHATRLSDISPGEQVFFFLRDPISRYVSGFYSRKREGRPRYASPWSPAECCAFSCFATPDALAMALTSSDTSLQLAAVDAMHSISHVRDRYSRWFGSDEYVRARLADIFFIGRQESLAADFARLKDMLGLDPALALPEDAVSAHKNPPECDRRLSVTAIENLKKWYEEDFLFMHLCQRLRLMQSSVPAFVF